LKQSQNIRWKYYIDKSKLHPANWTHWAPCKCWQRRRWTRLFRWNFASKFKPCICVAHVLSCLFQWGFNKPCGYHLLCLFLLVMLFMQ